MSCESGGCGACEAPCQAKVAGAMENLRNGFAAKLALQEALREEFGFSDEEIVELTCKVEQEGPGMRPTEDDFEPILVVKTLYGHGDVARFIQQHRDVLEGFGIKTVQLENLDVAAV